MTTRLTTTQNNNAKTEELIAFAQALFAEKIISEEAAQKVRHQGAVAAARLQAAHAEKRPPSAIETLVALGIVDETTNEVVDPIRVMEIIAKAVKLPFERIDPLKLDAEFVTKFFSKPFANRYLFIPLRQEGDQLIIATGHPFDRESRELALRSIGRNISFVLALPTEIERVVREFYGFRTSIRKAQTVMRNPSVEVQSFEQFIRIRGDRELEASDQHIINAVDYLFRYAVDMRASDIHIEPKRENSLVRFRIDGVLHNVYTLPTQVNKAIVSRIKLLSRMDIAERRKPQDGRIKTAIGETQVEMRVSTLPVAFGEKMVIRLFDASVVGNLNGLGFRGRELQIFEQWIREPHGIILVTGPTGSGKSTTLYSALKAISTELVNVVSIEDPIEMLFDHMNQVAVQPQVGITFAAALRTILRQDPDIIMVGEIRDGETAQYAVQAALTGHLVLSTLHTNDAPTAIARLTDLGLEPFLLASSLTGIMAQRLVRRVCASCAIEQQTPIQELRALGIELPNVDSFIPLLVGEGCNECRNTGYRGRVAIFEMMELTPAIRSAIQTHSDIQHIRKLATTNGMRSLRQAGGELVMEGLTTIAEVLRVTSDIEV